MANEKFLKGRFQQKIDIKENWDKAKNFVPLEGEIIVYKDLNKIKIGDGEKTVGELNFATGEQVGEVTEKGGIVFGDYENNDAGKFAVAFGSNTNAEGEYSMAAGCSTPKKDAKYTLDENGNAIYDEKDYRKNEAFGLASTAAGLGAVAYSMGSKSLGYRTQAGYPFSEELINKRPEAIQPNIDITDTLTFTAYNEEADNTTVNLEDRYVSIRYRETYNEIGDTESYCDYGGIWCDFPTPVSAFSLSFDARVSPCAKETTAVSILAKQLNSTTYVTLDTFPINETKTKYSKVFEFSNTIEVIIIVENLPDWCEAGSKWAVASLTNITFKSRQINIVEDASLAAVALGSDTASVGKNAISSGTRTIAEGNNSIATGLETQANAGQTFVGGQNCIANVRNSIAFGLNNVTNVAHSAVFGVGSNTSSGVSGQMVVGCYNAYENGEINDAIFVVGNGYGEYYRTNALVVNYDGSVRIAGNIYSNNKLLATEEHVKDYVDNIVRYDARNNSLSFGNKDANATGLSSTAFGYNTIATGKASVVFGSNTNAEGECSIASGCSTPKKDAEYTLDKKGNAIYNENDYRKNEAIGLASIASGLGSVAYSPGSKSLGYRTQTGYPLNEKHITERPEVVKQTDENGNVIYPTTDDLVGLAAVALGSDTVAIGKNSTSIGTRNIAKGNNSLATGLDSQANAGQTFVGGQSCVANVRNSIAFGSSNEANGVATSVFGYYNKSSDKVNGQTVIGSYNAYENGVIDNAMFVVGSGTGNSNRKNALVVNKDGSVKISGDVYSNDKLLATQEHVKDYIENFVHYDVEKDSLSFGNSGANATGNASVAFGSDTNAGGLYSFAAGLNNEVIGTAQSVFGYRNKSSKLSGQTIVGYYNAYENGVIDNAIFVVGNGYSEYYRTNALVVNSDGSVKISGDINIGDTIKSNWQRQSVRFNHSSNNASGYYASAFGSMTTASGVGSFAAGVDSRAIVEGSVALCGKVYAKGSYSLAAGGNGTTTEGMYSAAFGENAKATGQAAIALGASVTASGMYSCAIGNGSKASGTGSLAVGYKTEVTERYSVATGYQTKAPNSYAFVTGNNNQTWNQAQAVFGQYNDYKNKVAADKAYLVVGNGSDDASRSNAFVVQADGNVKVAGNVFVNNKPLATKEYVDSIAKGQYELIEDFTLEEEVKSITRSIDLENNSYDFTSIKIIVSAPAATAKAQIIFNVKKQGGDSLVYHQVTNALSTSGTYTIFCARNDHGMIEHYAATGASGSSIPNMTTRLYYSTYWWHNIKSFTLSTYTSSTTEVMIPAGTRVMVFGVREVSE